MALCRRHVSLNEVLDTRLSLFMALASHNFDDLGRYMGLKQSRGASLLDRGLSKRL